MNPQKIKVLQVLECGGPGGTGNQVAAIVNGLDRSRFDSILVYAVRPPSLPKDYEALARGASRFIYVPEMVREISPLKDARAWLALHRLFRAERPDVIHAHSSKAGFLARTAAWASGAGRIFYSPRGYSFLQTDRSRLSRWLYKALERSVSWIGEVIAVSQSEAQLARRLGAKVHVVEDAYLGTARARSDKDDGRQTVVCAAGRMSFPRNPQAFVRLAQRLTDSRNSLRCLWIGGGELEGTVREMIRDMNLAGKLEITGWLPHEKAIETLKTADIFVHFSRWEGLPNAVAEAMAMGLPVVASNIPGNRDLIRHGENGYLAATEVELLERTLELVDKPQLRDSFGEKGQAFVREKLSLERMLAALARLYSPGSETSAKVHRVY